MSRFLARASVLGLILAATSAPDRVDAQLPAAKDLIAAWAKASKADAAKGHKSSRMIASLDLPAAGMSAKMETIMMYSPMQSVQKMEIAGLGEIRSGFNGDVEWSMNPMQGPSVSRQSTAQRLEDADPNNYSRTSSAIVSSETVEKTNLGGADCYKVKHTWKSGRVSYDCFGVADGLITWSNSKSQTPMGEIETTQTFAAYKDFGGVLRATTVTADQAGQQIVITVQSWEWDTVDPKEFELPAEIKALAEKKP